MEARLQPGERVIPLKPLSEKDKAMIRRVNAALRAKRNSKEDDEG